MSKLHFFYGTMNAGKTTQLLQTNYNFNQNNIHTIVIKPSIDTRNDPGIIRSRIGIETKAYPLKNINNETLSSLFHPTPKVILVDEAQFFSKDDIRFLAHISDNTGILLFCYGLLIDINENLFEGSKALVESGATLHQLKSNCQIKGCMHTATHHLRFVDGQIDKSKESVIIGDTEYKSVCRMHWNKFMGESR